MKKYLLALSIFLTSPAFADTISIQPFISNNDVTIAHLEAQRTTIQNWANGNVEGGTNIKPGSLVSQDFSNSVSLVKYRDEAFNDFTFSGMLPVTDSDLTSDISAGISYVNGVRIETSAQAHTYTASKDTYVYINAGEFFDFVEVANGAAAPSTPANDLLLAKVVTSGSAITSVSDLRTTSIQIAATASNFPMDYRNQCFMSWDSTTTTHVEPGNISIGATIYTRTADTSSKSIATATNWIEGSVPNLTTSIKIYAYAYNDSGSSWDFKYSSIDPVNSDTSSGTAGILRYLTTGGVTYRAIGWLQASADAVQVYAVGNFPDIGVRNKSRRLASPYVNLGAATIPYDDTIPLSTEGKKANAFRVAIVPSSPNSKLHVRSIGHFSNNTAERTIFAICRDALTNCETATISATNDAQAEQISIDYETTAGSIALTEFYAIVGTAGGSTVHQNGPQSGATRAFGGRADSFIEIEEIPS